MSQAKEVEYFDTVKIILDFLKQKNIPFQLMNIQDENGKVQAAGIGFENARWNDKNVLVESKEKSV